MGSSCDVCVVGAGPAGLTIANELAARGINVLVVESGGWKPTVNSRQFASAKSVGYPYHKLEKALFSGVGGSAQLWWGNNRFRPLDPIDFESREGIPHSGWPFGLDHLVPYYERAQTVLSLGPLNYTTDFWEQPPATPRLPLPDAQIDTAIFQTTSGRDSGARVIAGLAADPQYQIMVESTVTELVLDENGTRVEAASIRHADGTESRIDADLFILAAGALDNTRLLLVSNRRWAQGLGNTHDLVGRFFMEHPAVSTAHWQPSDPAIFERSGLYMPHTVRGTPIIGTLTVAADVKRREGLLNAAIFLSVSDELKTTDAYRSLVMLSPKGLKNMRWTPSMYAKNLLHIVGYPLESLSTLLGVLLKRSRRREKVFDLRVVSEQAPNPDSRVLLDSKLDARGLPRLKLDWRFTELDKWSIRRTQEVLRDSIQSAGLGSVEHLYGDERPPARIYGQRHQIGTTRMHEDPKRGVVDPDCRVHGLHNLFVAGSSVFPTAGHANTTLTLVALALRLSDHIGELFVGRKGITAD